HIPFGVVKGVEDGPTVGITAGIHGCDNAGIEGAARLFQQLDPQSINGTVICVPVVNMPGFIDQTPYVGAVVGPNVNRLVPGSMSGAVEHRLAYKLFHDIALRCDYLLDFHGADRGEEQFPNVITFLTGDENSDAQALSLAQAFGTEYIRLNQYKGTPSVYLGEAKSRGIPGLFVEIGGEGRYDEADIQMYIEGTLNVLGHLGMIDREYRPLETFDRQKTVPFPEGGRNINAREGGVYHPQLRTRDTFYKGDILVKITDIWGETLEEHAAPCDGIVRKHPTARVAKAGDTLMSLIDTSVAQEV
ncbi:MAG: succinylglutamate desuccinylase/aspartoacylase family protein, partial [Thermaerobacterales bacterium]